MDIESRRLHNLAILTESLPSTDPGQYAIDRNHYKRSCGEDRSYRILWKLSLLREYDCRCGVCGDDTNGLELDHFFVPKSKGGIFRMVREARYSENNAVPLCMSCNRKKSDGELAIDDNVKAWIAFANLNMSARLGGGSSLSHPLTVEKLIKATEYDIQKALHSKADAARYLANEINRGREDLMPEFLYHLDVYCLAVLPKPKDRIYPVIAWSR